MADSAPMKVFNAPMRLRRKPKPTIAGVAREPDKAVALPKSNSGAALAKMISGLMSVAGRRPAGM